MIEFSDQDKASLVMASFVLVILLSFVYMGWLMSSEAQQSSYFAGAMDAMHYAQSSQRCKDALAAKAQAAASSGVRPTAWEARRSVRESIDGDMPKPSVGFQKRASLSGRVVVIPGDANVACDDADEIDIDTDDTEQSPLSSPRSPKTPPGSGGGLQLSRMESGFGTEAGTPRANPVNMMFSGSRGSSVGDETGLWGGLAVPQLYSREGHFMCDEAAIDKEAQAWPDPYTPCLPSALQDHMLLAEVRKGSLRWVNAALDVLHADVRVRTQLGYGVLHEALSSKHSTESSQVSQRLTAYIAARGRSGGAIAVDQRTSYGTTLLMKAISADDLDIAAALIEAGADVDAQDVDGNTPLMHGCIHGNPRAARFLVPFGADPHLVNKDGVRAVDLALLHGNARVATDMEGAAAVVVPGYISTATQNTAGAASLAYTVLRQLADAFTDVLVTVSLWESDRNQARATLAFTLLPSVYMALAPYQTVFERIITLMQLRVAYEALVSMNIEKTTVRFGAMYMIQTVFQSSPQLLLQSSILAARITEGADITASSTGKALLSSVALSAFSAGECFKTMYLMKYNLPKDIEEVPSSYDTFGCLASAYSFLGVCLRVMFWVLLVNQYPRNVVIVAGSIVGAMRIRLASMRHGSREDLTMLDISGIDIFALLLTDLPFSGNSQQFYLAELLTLLENTAVIWHAARVGEWYSMLIVLACMNLVKELSFLQMTHNYIHGECFHRLDCKFLWEFLMLRGMGTFLWGFFQGLYRAGHKSLRYYGKVLRYKAFWWDAWLHEKSCCLYCFCVDATRTDKQRKAFLELHRKLQKVSSSVPAPFRGLVKEMSTGSGQLNSDSVAEAGLQNARSGSDSYTSFKLSRLMWRDVPPLLFLLALLGLLWVVMWAHSPWSTLAASCSLCDAGHNLQFLAADPDAPGCCPMFEVFALRYSLGTLVAVYVVSFGEALTSPLSAALKRCFPAERCYDMYLRAVGGARPNLLWRSESYHWVERKGGGRQKVVTHSAVGEYKYTYWVDASDPFKFLGQPFLHISTESSYFFADAYTRLHYKQERDAFYALHDRDTHQDQQDDTTYGPAKEDKILKPMLFHAQGSLYFLKYTYYLYAAFLSLSFFYRWFVNSITSDMKLRMRKMVYQQDPEAIVQEGQEHTVMLRLYQQETNKQLAVGRVNGNMLAEEAEGRESDGSSRAL